MTEQEELRMLRERLGPRGLEVVVINGAGHYVNEKVKAEIDRLRDERGRVDRRTKHQQMREAINAVELALNGLEIDAVMRQWEGAADSVMVKLPLGALRQLGRCYPELNRIINDPVFENTR